ncbi:ATP-binding cassette domain-containing protein [Sporosarcina sp. resist]|uniref:ATP-binding cassette domain-containing protein n=1 Tax=Sporosarcina sp. resist TaxID=2762563 RepID=UPI00164E4C92|nr:ATP-binding cassette domain-containing protein [Sporosarcina sp. resist]QNK89856.1 ATP-binding cassette domain-containing protein [Sporosarcina sp. resist]
MIQINNLSKTIKGKKILDNLTINLNGITGIIGPNGAGKSTLMKIIASVESADKGSGFKIEQINKEKLKLGYLPQEFSIYPNLTVLEVLKLLATLKNNFDNHHIEHLLEILNLTDYKEMKMKHLSGGLKRRVGIAQALLDKPNYLIIDEPTAGLDMIECINLRNILLNIGEEVDIVISSHIPEDIEYICNHIVVMDCGKKRFEGQLSKMIELTKNLTYETIIEINNIGTLKEIGKLVKIDKVSNSLAKVVFVTTKPLSNDLMFKNIAPLFSGSYVSLLDSDLAI